MPVIIHTYTEEHYQPGGIINHLVKPNVKWDDYLVKFLAIIGMIICLTGVAVKTRSSTRRAEEVVEMKDDEALDWGDSYTDEPMPDVPENFVP